MMNAGGFRVSPLEVEAALAGCPGVAEVAVAEHRVRDDVRIIAAYVVRKEGAASRRTISSQWRENVSPPTNGRGKCFSCRAFRAAPTASCCAEILLRFDDEPAPDIGPRAFDQALGGWPGTVKRASTSLVSASNGLPG